MHHQFDTRMLSYLPFQPFMVGFHFLFEPHHVGEQSLPAQFFGFFKDGNVMTAIGSTQSCIHTSHATTDDSYFFAAQRSRKHFFADALHGQWIDHTAAVKTHFCGHSQLFPAHLSFSAAMV